jgi:hypothetical protein
MLMKNPVLSVISVTDQLNTMLKPLLKVATNQSGFVANVTDPNKF